MKKHCLLSSIAILGAIAAFGQERLTSLQCEHLENPLGIDTPAPRLSWMLPDGIAAQKSWTITVGTDSLSVSKGSGNMWSSGPVASGKVLATYAGKALEPCTKYWWTVNVATDDGRNIPGPVASFETGKMCQDNWEGWWIYDTKDLELRPSGAFRKEFRTKGKVVSARAYIAVGGLFECYINGQKVGDDRLEPDFTRFDRRILYITRDITGLVNSNGDNAVGILLGNGWYNHQPMAVWDYEKAPWRHRPCFSMDIELTYEDGSVETVKTDKSWKTNLTDIVFNSIYVGEHVDHRISLGDWTRPGYDESAWKGVATTVCPAAKLESQQMRPIRDVDTLRTVSMTKISDTDYIFDFGYNISGVTELRISGEKGTEFRIRHGEYLEDGHVSTYNLDMHYHPEPGLDEPFATDIFILGGDGEETFRQTFGYKGFRYAEVTTDRPVDLGEDNMVAYFMYSDIPVRGSVTSSNEVLNWIWDATCRSYVSNLVGYPTDCPHREKNGWTGDTNMAMDVGFYNFDPITVYEKWMEDHKDAQLPNGVLPNIIPSPGWAYDWNNGIDWTGTNITVPWHTWLFYGDDHLLRTMYPHMKAWLGFLERTYPTGLTDYGQGDHLPFTVKTNLELVASVYYYDVVRTMAKISALLGHGDDAGHYETLARKIRDAVNEKYLDREKGIYASGMQTEMALPLHWGVVPDDCRQKVADNLAADLAARGLDVGLLGSTAILGALSANGHLDDAYRLAVSTDFPSWGYWMKDGATTLYENWRIDDKLEVSMNHIMHGEVCAWFHKVLAGITPDENHPGFAEFNVEPGFATGLDRFEATHTCPYGEIRSGWTRKGKKVEYSLTVPSGTIAHLTLPDGSHDLTCGTYTYKFKIKNK